MIERILAAQRARAAGDLELAEVLLGQVVAADPRNVMAIVGLAQLALDRGDVAGAEVRARQALELDPHEAAARQLVAELERQTAVEPPAARRSWFQRLLDRLFGRRDLPS